MKVSNSRFEFTGVSSANFPKQEEEANCHDFSLDLENDLKSKQEFHINQIHKAKKEIGEILDQYEKKVNDDFNMIKKQVLEGLAESSQICINAKVCLLNLQSKCKNIKEQLISIISETFPSSLFVSTFEDYLAQDVSKKTNHCQQSSLSTCRTSNMSDSPSIHISPDKNCLVVEAKIESIEIIKPRPFTFGKTEGEDGNAVKISNLMEEIDIKSKFETTELEKTKEKREAKESKDEKKEKPKEIQQKTPIAQKEEVKKDKKDEKLTKLKKNEPKPKPVTEKTTKYSPPSSMTQISDEPVKSHKDIDEDLIMKETDVRFLITKKQGSRVFKKPETNFEAVSFTSKSKDTVLEGFGFYCPLPSEGARIDLEYRIYEGLQKESKELMKEEISFECDAASVKESLVSERILLNFPITLKKKKTYTIVLRYKNDVKVSYNEVKWRDVGPFNFSSIEKRQVKEWLGVKTFETEKITSSQFPYLIYSEV